MMVETYDMGKGQGLSRVTKQFRAGSSGPCKNVFEESET